MSNERVKNLLDKNNHKLIRLRNNTEEAQQFCGVCDDPCAFAKDKISRRQRFLIKTTATYLAKKNNRPVSTVNSSLKRFLDIRRLDDMSSVQFPKAIDFLISQG